MVISNKENQDLHAILFENKENYNKWASCFYDDFVLVYSELNGSIAGVMTPNLVRIDNRILSMARRKRCQCRTKINMKFSN